MLCSPVARTLRSERSEPHQRAAWGPHTVDCRRPDGAAALLEINGPESLSKIFVLVLGHPPAPDQGSGHERAGVPSSNGIGDLAAPLLGQLCGVPLDRLAPVVHAC
jgi:hypothetical protein